jgi:hypothetical protein
MMLKSCACGVVGLVLLTALACGSESTTSDSNAGSSGAGVGGAAAGIGSGGLPATSGNGSLPGGSTSVAGGGASAGTAGAGPQGGGGSAAGSGSAGSAGGTGDAALEAACTPEFTLSLEDTGPKAQIFEDAVNGDAQGFVQNIGRGVCRILYRKAEEVRAANHITLHIEDTNGVAWKAGDIGDIDVGISTQHLQNVKNEGRDVAAEISGILFHEMTHMYQNDDKPEATFEDIANMYEGIADAVRIRAGYTPEGAQPDKNGSWAEKTYTGQAFFWLYIDDEHPNFVYELNKSMAKDGKPWAPSAIETITGKSVDAWWSAYEGAACCAGGTRDCCK